MCAEKKASGGEAFFLRKRFRGRTAGGGAQTERERAAEKPVYE